MGDTVGITPERAWERALEYDPLQTDALAGLARSHATKGDHGAATKYYERLRGLGLPQTTVARYESSSPVAGRVDPSKTRVELLPPLSRGRDRGSATGLPRIADAASDRETGTTRPALDAFF